MGLFGDIKGTRQNTFEIGNGQTGDKSLVARNGDANPPKVRYNDTSNLWQYSNDGTTWKDLPPSADDVLPSQGGNSGKFLTTNGTTSSWGTPASGGITWSSKTGAFNASAGNGYLADTNASAFTGTLPGSPSDGDIVYFADARGTWGTNNCTVGRNSKNINGVAEDLICDVSGDAFGLIYYSTTGDWRFI